MSTERIHPRDEEPMGMRPAEKITIRDKAPLFLGIWPALLLAAIAFLVYWPSLKSDFVFDARAEILEEGFITSVSNLPAVLSLKVLGMNLMLADRPGQLLYLMLIGAVCGKDPFLYHLCSNFLHAANVALLYVLLFRLASTEVTGFARRDLWKLQLAIAAVTLIFALHPIAVEPVAGVNYSSDLLVTFFTLIAVLAATVFNPDNLRIAIPTGVLGTLCAFAAVTCKESGMAVAPILIVYWFLFRRREAKRPWLVFLGAAISVTAAFLAARFVLAPPVPFRLGYLGGSFPEVFLIQPKLWVFMMGKIFWPMQFSADYTMENMRALTTPFAMAILGVVFVLQVWLALKSRLGALGVAFYWLGLVTVSNFMPLYIPMADRFYYLPLAGAAMQLLAVLAMTLRHSPGFWLAVVPLLGAALPLTLFTLTREKVFAGEFALWTDTVQTSPYSAIAHNGLANDLLQKGQVDEAMTEFQKALLIEPNFDRAHNNLGVAYLRKGHADQAMAEWKKALEINPGFAEAHNNLGNSLAQKGQVDAGIAECQKALQINPYFADAHYNLGMALMQKGQADGAIAEYRRAAEINPADAQVHNNLGIALLQKGETDEGTRQLQKAAELDPSNAEAQQNLGSVLLQTGRIDEAIAQFQKILGMNPKNGAVAYNLGLAFLQKGALDDAISQFQNVVKIDPDSTSARTNLGVTLIQQGKIGEAIAQFKEVVRLKPGNINAQNNLAKAQAMAGQASGSK